MKSVHKNEVQELNSLLSQKETTIELMRTQVQVKYQKLLYNTIILYRNISFK